MMRVLAGLMLVLAVVVTGCSDEGTEVGTTLPSEGAETSAQGTVIPGATTVGESGGDESSANDTDGVVGEEEQNQLEECGEECPEGYCDEATNTCKECLSWADCDQTAGEWCKEDVCVSTLCVPGDVQCQGVTTLATCSSDGEVWEKVECEGEQLCTFGECKAPICEAGEVTCGFEQKKICNATGTGWTYAACPPGFACKDQECEPIRNNVIVVMDTSGSMAPAPSLSLGGGGNGCADDSDCPAGEQCCDDILGTGAKCTADPGFLCLPPNSGGLLGGLGNVACVCGEGNCQAEAFPQCESLECPISKLGLAKYTLNNLIESGEFDAANVVLQHFPQQVTPNPSLECSTDPLNISLDGEKRGWYFSSGFTMTGDSGAHITVAGDYFDTHLHEVLSVPFPATAEEDTIAQLSSWIDGDETMEPTDIPCQGNNECAGGYCGESGGQNVCFFHGSPELRALGGTPLGRSLFYAGEYIRRHVVIGGKVCETDADCGNVNYYCNPDNNRCFDPLESCRGTVIVMLSDGACSAANDNTSSCEDDPFFEPEHTAKRLRYGLGCEEDSDCGEGATCQNGSCQGYDLNYGFETFSYTDYAEGVQRLYGQDGQPLQVTTHTIFIHEANEGSSGATMNKNIADHGGGLYFDVETDKPEGLVEAINSILNVKENISNCVPFLPDGVRRL